MARAGYSVITGAAIAVVGAAPKSVLGVKSAADFGLDLKKVKFTFDGVTASAIPALAELCVATFATNGPGTNSTSRTPTQKYGRVMAHGVTAASNWTAGNEPTVLTVIEELLVPPTSGYVYDFPLGDTPDCDLANGFVLRITPTANVNVRATLEWERV